MKTPISFAIAAVALFAAHTQAIDFTPRISDSVDDGVPIRRTYFSDGGRRIFYRPPVTWSQIGRGDAAVFRPNASSKATVTIQNAPSEHARIPFNDAGLGKLREFATTLLPQDATDPAEIWEVVNPVVLQGWTSFEIGFDYVEFGQRICRSVLFINIGGGRQVRFIVDAPPAEFEALYKTTYRTFATWWEPKDGELR